MDITEKIDKIIEETLNFLASDPCIILFMVLLTALGGFFLGIAVSPASTENLFYQLFIGLLGVLFSAISLGICRRIYPPEY